MAVFWTLGISVTLVLAAIGFAFKFGKWYGEVNSDRSNFKEFMNEVGAKLDKIFEHLPPPSPLATGSPIRLTDLGQRISRETSAGKWADDEFEMILDKTQGKDEFEIQTIAFEHALNFEPSEELLARMRASAFDNGPKLEGVRQVLGVVLRDRILSERGLPPSSTQSQPS